jgi:hypothetical protein
MIRVLQESIGFGCRGRGLIRYRGSRLHIFKQPAHCRLLGRLVTFFAMERKSGKRSPLERRSAARYRLQLPVIFHWKDTEAHTEGGFTFDVARDGVLIRSKVCPPVGSTIRVEVLVPSVDVGGVGMRVECVGQVTRVNDRGGIMRFGVAGDFDDAHLTPEIGDIETADLPHGERVQ